MWNFPVIRELFYGFFLLAWKIFKVPKQWRVFKDTREPSLSPYCSSTGCWGQPVQHDTLPLPHRAHHCPNIHSIYSPNRERRGVSKTPRICYGTQTDPSVSADLFLHLYVCWPLPLCSIRPLSVSVGREGGNVQKKASLWLPLAPLPPPLPPPRELPAGSGRGSKEGSCESVWQMFRGGGPSCGATRVQGCERLGEKVR